MLFTTRPISTSPRTVVAKMALLIITVSASFFLGGSTHAQIGEFSAVQLDNGLSAPYVRMTNPDDDQQFIVGFSTLMGFYVKDSYKFFIDETAVANGLDLDGDGATIRKELEVLGTDSVGPSLVQVNNANMSAIQNRTMFQLINNGGSRFNFVDTSLGTSWTFASNTVGDFSVSLNGTGGSEFKIQKNGRVFMGPGGAPNFDLRPSGNLFLDGSLIESSDRNQKRDIELVNSDDVLKKITEMPVTEWSYKKDPTVRHIGPMAQDFHSAFGLGADNLHVSARDIASVSLIAIKAQQQKIESQANAIEVQRQTIEELMERLERLESSVHQK